MKDSGQHLTNSRIFLHKQLAKCQPNFFLMYYDNDLPLPGKSGLGDP